MPSWEASGTCLNANRRARKCVLLFRGNPRPAARMLFQGLSVLHHGHGIFLRDAAADEYDQKKAYMVEYALCHSNERPGGALMPTLSPALPGLRSAGPQPLRQRKVVAKWLCGASLEQGRLLPAPTSASSHRSLLLEKGKPTPPRGLEGLAASTAGPEPSQDLCRW